MENKLAEIKDMEGNNMKIYNTLTRQKEEFKPIDENEIKIYVSVQLSTTIFTLEMPDPL